MEERIECFNCGKLFAVKLKGFVISTPSTQLRFEADDDETTIEIMCGRCKKETTLIFK
jgi:phage FluMu protein Com